VYSKREAKKQPFQENNEENITSNKANKRGKKHIITADVSGGVAVDMDAIKSAKPVETPIKVDKSRHSDSQFSTPRRSSIALRGKRASDAYHGMCRNLIHLTLAPPHPTVNPKDYYSFIDAQLSDPLRMRQLLLWGAMKTLDNNPNSRRIDHC
jgi:Mis12-Mtw1 protein family